MTCRSRKLEADGFIAPCTIDRHERDSHVYGEWLHEGQEAEWVAFYVWLDDDPCAWEAPDCSVCGGRGANGGSMIPGHPEPADICDACGGSGVDETVPTHLIGVGSRLVHDVDPLHVIVTGFDEKSMVPILRRVECVVMGSHEEHIIEGPFFYEDGDDWTTGWTLVRAVPPAHEEQP